MFGIFRYPRSLPPLSQFPIKSYKFDFSLDRLILGVDNISHDVLLSPAFVASNQKVVTQLVARHAGVEKRTGQTKQISWNQEVARYKQFYRDILQDAVNKAKGQSEFQVELLAQAALTKMLLQEIRAQYERLIRRLKKAVRKSDLAAHNDLAEAPKLKTKLQRILQDREAIQQLVGLEICSFWYEVEVKEVRPMHEAIFGKRRSCYTDVLNNPILHVDQPDNELFMLAEYDFALGRRIEDPDKYESLLFFIRHLLNYIDLMDPTAPGHSVEQRLTIPKLQDQETNGASQKAYNQKIKGWVQHEDNMDVLLNWQRTKGDYQVLRKKNGDAGDLADLKNRVKGQKKLLHFFYRQFRQNGLMERIVASYEMLPEYLEYCPPLIPQQIIQYLTVPKSRKVIKNRLKRMKKVYNRSFSLRPLHKKIKSLEQMTAAKRKAYLVRFMNAFVRFHRDKSNAELIHEAMERIHLATEEKVINLSRENNTLYEFLLPHEQASVKAPIINHVVVKADVRGSTDITHQMNERGLNPASYFSLNFFDPISGILAEYGASKIFIEGDAIILSIFEREDTPSGWYGVARACGIAINMLVIIQRYNQKSIKYQLPILELGIGIGYLANAPTFLFDGNNRIMISPAINHADRLSSCSKTGRRLFANKKSLFKAYVFQTLSDEDMAATKDDLYTRFNVNGIELNPAGFEKLSREIDLKLLQSNFADLHGQKSNLYFGKFPTKSGRYQRLLVREAHIPVVDPSTLKTQRITSHKYYEVCTHPKLYAWARQLQG